MKEKKESVDRPGQGKGKYGSDAFEIAVGEGKKSKYITLPLSYDFEFSPVDDNGGSVPISSIMVCGTKTTIKTSGSTSQWRLKVMKSTDLSNTDPTGTTSPPDGDENGDRFVDWLGWKASNVDDEAKLKVQNATRKIVFEKEGA